MSLGGAAYLSGRPSQLADLGRVFLDLVASGAVQGMVEAVVGLDGVLHALETVAAGKARGKVVVQVVDEGAVGCELGASLGESGGPGST